MFLIVKHTECGDQPIKIKDENTTWWVKPDMSSKTLTIFIYYENIGVKDFKIKFDRYDDLKDSVDDLSKQVIEYQNKLMECEKLKRI